MPGEYRMSELHSYKLQETVRADSDAVAERLAWRLCELDRSFIIDVRTK